MSLQNLYTLRDKVFPIVFEMDKQGRVNLDYVDSDCGTAHCLFGWYRIITGEQILIIASPEHFNLDSASDCRLFTGSSGMSLADRYNYLCNLITEREAQLVPERNFIKEIEEIIQRSDLIHDEIAERQLITLNNLQAFTESVSKRCEIE